MNENLEASPNAIRLLKTRERGPTDGSVELTPGGGAKTAYPCDPGGELTIGYGCLKWFDGEDVNLTHRLSSEDEATALLKLQLKFFEDGVRAMLTREATQSQFDGMLCLAFNIGLAAFKGSSVLRFFNEGRMEDAAASFGMWTGATCTVVPRWLRNDPELGPQYAGKYALDHKGTPRWVGPDGQYCGYMLRLKGYMPRHYSEALLFLNREWEPTIDGPKRIRLEIQSDHPSRATWNGSKGRWEDGVKYRTPFKDVYAAAYDDLLPEPELILSTPLSPATPAPVTAPSPAVADKGSAVGAQPSPAPTASSPVSPAPIVVPPARVEKQAPVIPAPSAKPAPAPVPAPAPKPASPPVVAGEDGTKPKSPWTVQPEDVHYKIDPGAGLKPLEDSDRAKAFYWQRTFMFIIYIGGTGVFGSSMLAGSELLMKHAALMSVVLDLAVPAAMALSALALGAVGKSWADWRRHCAQQRASQALY